MGAPRAACQNRHASARWATNALNAATSNVYRRKRSSSLQLRAFWNCAHAGAHRYPVLGYPGSLTSMPEPPNRSAASVNRQMPYAFSGHRWRYMRTTPPLYARRTSSIFTVIEGTGAFKPARLVAQNGTSPNPFIPPSQGSKLLGHRHAATCHTQFVPTVMPRDSAPGWG